jgi:rhodanese-related sulfurtransferase
MQGDPNAVGYTRAEVEQWRASGRRVVAVDVRSAEEFAAGTALGAQHVPPDQLDALAASVGDAIVVTVCNHGGGRSQGAAARLRALGVASARHLEGGVLGRRG